MKKDWEARREEISAMDRELWARGIRFAGMDEVGRGPLAGPVAAACVIMPRDPLLLYVDDSKKLSEKRRETLSARILEIAEFSRIEFVEAGRIDEINILNATREAMTRAAGGAPCGLFLVDAISSLPVEGEVRGIVHGDAACYSIAAASIIAKVARDRLMVEMDAKYPEYGFARNKGYGTREHIDALRKYGPCPLHRRSFIGNFVSGAACP